MLEALLEQLSDAGLSSGHIRWTAPMAGVRVCDFDCAPPERFPARPTHPHLETLYAAVRAANGVPELRRRIRGDQVVEYDRCPSSPTVALPDGTYCYCSLEVDRPFREFLPYAAAEQERVKAAPTLEDGEDGESLFFVSCVPWLSYTALTQPTPTPADSNPRITWGRWHRQGGRTLLPMTLLANHALVDGIHIARLYENLDRELAALCGGEKTEY